MSNPTCIVLAAGQGTRMKSSLPKVLHPVLGRPMILRLLSSLASSRIVLVVGHEAARVEEVVRAGLPGGRIDFALQREQRGTGHAVATALGSVPRSCTTLVVINGDLPLLTAATVRKIVARHRKTRAAVTLATTRLDDPTGYGRILRVDGGQVAGIREQKDCSPAERAIEELNAGLYCFSRRFLERHVSRLTTGNVQKEFYLTDMVQIAADAGRRVTAVPVPSLEVTGINSRSELARVEAILLERVRAGLMKAGVTIQMPASVWIEDRVRVGRDTVIGPRAIIRGETRIGRGCTIGAGCVIEDTRIDAGVVLKPYSTCEDSRIRTGAIVGPYARLRPGSDVGPGAHVGNFVELKKTIMGRGSKANHLSYLGDGRIGRNVNIGAGTIFCNYDGFGKHVTELGDDVFIGSDSQMVAPVRVGRGSYVASGSTITSDVPEDSLALARARQVTKRGRAQMLRRILASRKRKTS